VTETEANELSIYVDKWRNGFMIMDASACPVSPEGEHACRFYGTDGNPSRQPLVRQEFATKEAALAFAKEKLSAKARENKAKADKLDEGES
jgi:hypothetical protein